MPRKHRSFSDLKSPLVYAVDWVDHSSGRGWVPFDKIDGEGLLCHAVGFLVAETDQSMTLTASIYDDKASDPLTILKSCILRKKRIRLT